MHTTRFIIPSANQYKELNPFVFDFFEGTDKHPAVIKIENTGPFAVTFVDLMGAIVAIGAIQCTR